MTMKKILSSTSTLLMVLSLCGCVVASGGKRESYTSPTLGQQLVDLQKARDSGAISDAEYQAQKQKLLEK